MSNQPQQPPDPPTEGAGPADNPPGQGRSGIAHNQGDHDATGLPTDDRHDTETATNRTGGADDKS